MTLKKITLSIIEPLDGAPWSVQFEVDDSTPIPEIVNFPITLISGGESVTFDADYFHAKYGSGHAYSRWRSTDPETNDPTNDTGFFVQFWSPLFTDNVSGLDGEKTPFTWKQMLNGSNGYEDPLGGTCDYPLETDVYCLVYRFEGMHAYALSRGGSVRVTIE